METETVSNTTFIYALLDPRSNEIRYIGKADNPQCRTKQHIATCSREKNYKARWLRSLKANGLCPIVEVVDEVLTTEWQPAEAAYIQFFKEDCGCRLANSTPGGDGSGSGKENPMFGRSPGLETRLKQSNARKGRFGGDKHWAFGKQMRPESRSKMIASLTGRKLSAEHRLKMSQAHRGKTFSDETRAKLSAAQSGEKGHWFGVKFSPETRARMSEARKGAKHHYFGKRFSDEHRAKLSASHKKKTTNP